MRAADEGSSERAMPRHTDAHGQVRRLLQSTCVDGTTDQLRAVATAAGVLDANMSLISTCAATMPLAEGLGFGCSKSQISAVCPVTCNSCPIVTTLAPTASPTTASPTTASPTYSPTMHSSTPSHDKPREDAFALMLCRACITTGVLVRRLRFRHARQLSHQLLPHRRGGRVPTCGRRRWPGLYGPRDQRRLSTGLQLVRRRCILKRCDRRRSVTVEAVVLWWEI